MATQKIIEKVSEIISKYDHLDSEIVADIFKVMKEKLEPFGISVRYYDADNIALAQELRTKVDGIVPGVKYILSSNGGSQHFDKVLVRKCCGIVLHVGEHTTNQAGIYKLVCKPLVLTVNAFNEKPNHEIVKKYIAEGLYNIHPIKDGSVVNIYYDPNLVYKDTSGGVFVGRWIMSTKKHAECDGVNWRGIEFGNVMDDVLSLYDFKLANLNKNISYSIGFQHPSYHIFDCPKPSAWIIAGFNTTTHEPVTQEELAITGLPPQEVCPVETAQNIYDKCNSAYGDYISQPDNERKKFLGYFLRSKDESKTKEYSDIILESSLWKEVKFCVYKQPYLPDKAIRKNYMEKFRDINKTILDNYLNKYKHAKFILLFPQYKPLYDIMDEIIDTVVKSLMDGTATSGATKTMKTFKAGQASQQTQQNQKYQVRGRNIPDTIKYFRKIVEEKYTLDSSADPKFLASYITHPRNLETFVMCIKNVAPEAFVGVKRIS